MIRAGVIPVRSRFVTVIGSGKPVFNDLLFEIPVPAAMIVDR